MFWPCTGAGEEKDLESSRGTRGEAPRGGPRPRPPRGEGAWVCAWGSVTGALCLLGLRCSMTSGVD